MKIEFTPAQQAAIGLDSLDKDTCVVAGPGSGKTTVLIERFRGLVASGVSPLRILAITFTEKATHQMRERLAAAFTGQSDLIFQIQRAYVSTVHGFCARLLRENAILAGVDPRFRVLNEQEAFALERKSVDDALDLFLTEKPSPVREVLSSLHSPDLGDSILDVYHAMRAAGMRLADLEGQPQTGGRAALDGLALQCDRILAGVFFDWTPSQKTQLAQVADWRGRLRERSGQPVSPIDFQILAEFNCSLGRIRRNNPTYDLIKQLKEDLIPAAEPVVAAEFHAIHRDTLIEAIGRFDALYRSRKANQSTLDFSDLEEFSVRLLEQNEEARERVRRQFDHVLMDEFQDTNGLQSRLLDLLRPPDRFYAVGDVNQSIYGFRHADPQVFEAYRARLQREGKRVGELRENWRSRGDILDAVTSLLGAADGIERHSFQPVRKFRRKSQPSVEVIRCFNEDSEEAKWVARRIGEVQGTLSLDRGPARFRDMAVLVRKADTIRMFTAAFDESGIPYVVTAGKGFFEASEVTDLMHLLRIIANPRDEISLAAVLRSPLAGIYDATLLLKKGTVTFLGDAFHSELTSWRESRHDISADRLLIRAMDCSGYELTLGPRERANIEKFLTLVREAGSRLSLDNLVEELERLRDSDPREQDSQAEESGDLVRVLTIHSAKGLEFPIVFLPSLQAGVNTNPGPVLLSPRLGLGVRWRNPVTGHSAKDDRYEKIAQERQAKEAAESNRLLYVAMTRAEEHLVLSCSGKLQNWAAYLEPNLGLDLQTPREEPWEQNGLRILCTDRPPAPQQQLSLVFESEAPEQVELPASTGQHDSGASVTSVQLFADCPRRYFLARYLGFDGERPRPMSEEEDEPAPDEVDATEFGGQVHALLAGGDRGGAHPEALTLVTRFESSGLGLRSAEAARVEREFDFMLTIEDVVLRGQIDLWFEESSELVIVDYKTDDIRTDEAPSRARIYMLQLQLYAIAVEKLVGRPVDRAVLYFLRPNVPVDVELDREGAKVVVGQFRQAQDRLNFPLNEGEHCSRCPFYRGMCPAQLVT